MELDIEKSLLFILGRLHEEDLKDKFVTTPVLLQDYLERKGLLILPDCDKCRSVVDSHEIKHYFLCDEHKKNSRAIEKKSDEIDSLIDDLSEKPKDVFRKKHFAIDVHTAVCGENRTRTVSFTYDRHSEYINCEICKKYLKKENK